MAANPNDLLRSIANTNQTLVKLQEQQGENLERLNQQLAVFSSGVAFQAALLQTNELLGQIRSELSAANTKLAAILKDGTPGAIARGQGEGAQEAANALATTAGAMGPLVRGLLLFRVAGGSGERFVGFISRLGQTFAQLDAKRMAEGAQAVNVMGLAVAKFGLALAASTVLYVIGAPGALLAAAAITGLGAVFRLLDAESVRDGARSVIFMAGGIASLGLSLFLFQAVDIKPSTVLLAALSVGALALVFGLAGMADKTIIKGAIALGAASLSLLVIAVGVLVFQKAEWDFEKLGLLAATIVSVGGLFALAGLLAVPILLGSLAFLLAGASLLVMATANNKFADIDVETPGVVKEGILAVAEGFGAISLKQGLAMLLGAPAVALAGMSLGQLSEGLKAFAKVEWDEDDSEQLINAVGAISAAFAQAGTDEGTTSFFGFNIGPNVVERGINSTMKAGKAMQSIVDGVRAFASLSDLGLPADSFTMETVNGVATPKQGTLLGNIYNVLMAFKSVFSEIGRSANEGDSLIKTIFGGDFAESDYEQGVESVRGTGKAIQDVVQGIRAFASLSELGLPEDAFVIYDGPGAKPTLLGNIKNVLTAVSSVFAEIGRSANQDTSLIKTIFGSDFSESDVEQGVESVQGMGKELKDIADGLVAFVDLSKLGLPADAFTLPEPGGPPTLLGNIRNVLTAVSSVFAEIGHQANGSESALKSLFGADFAQSDVELGVRSVQGAGAELKSIAEGVKSFADLSELGLNADAFNLADGSPVPGSLLYNIWATMGVVRESFARIGKDVDSGLFGTGAFSDNNVEEGIEAVEGAGKTLKNIAEGVKVFADPAYDAVAVHRNIYLTLRAIPRALSSLDGLQVSGEDDPRLRFMQGMVKGVVKLADKADPLVSVATSMDSIAASFADIANTFQKFDSQVLDAFASFIDSTVAFSEIEPEVLARNISQSAGIIDNTLNALDQTDQPASTALNRVEPADERPAKTAKEKETKRDDAALQRIGQLQSEMAGLRREFAGVRDLLERGINVRVQGGVSGI